jgi:hypothetical protein
MGEVVLEAGGVATSTDRVRFSARPLLRFDPLPNVLHPQMDIERELPIDK